MVLILLAMGALVVAGLLNRAMTRAEQSQARLDHMQARSLAQSGLEGVLAEMSTQRERMLAGEAPELTKEWTTPVVGPGGTRVGRVRLVALAQTPEGGDIVTLSQAACVDVMSMPAESLKKILGEKAGTAVAGARGARPMSSVLGAMNEAGLTGDAVAMWEPGEGEEAGGAMSGPASGPTSGAEAAPMGTGTGLENARRGRIVRGSAAKESDEGSDAFGAEQLLVRNAISVGTFDPIGLWTGEAVARVDLSGAVDSSEVEDVAKQIEDAFEMLGAADAASVGATGEDAGGEANEGESELEKRSREAEEKSKEQVARVSELMAKVFDSDAPPKKTSDLLKAMRKAGAAPSAWRLAWGVRFADDLYSRGRVDINRAPREVLAAVPGIDATAAEAIVSRRGGLSAEALADPTWPTRQGIITPEQLEQAADWITTRSLQWRVRIEAAVMDAADAEEEARGDAGAQSRPRRPFGVVTLEVVVDAAADRVRVAYLRDVSLEDAIARMERSQREAEEEAGRGDEADASADERKADAERGASDDDELADLRNRARATTRSERMAERARSDAESGRVRRGDASASRAAGNLRGQRGGGGGGGGGASGEGASPPAANAEDQEKPKRPARRELEARDNRTGRWRP